MIFSVCQILFRYSNCLQGFKRFFLLFFLLFRLCHHPHFVFFFLYPWASFTLHSDVTNKPILQFESFLWNELKWSQYGLWQWCRELNGSETKALGAKGRMKWHKSLSILTPVLLQHYLLFLGHFCFNGSVRPCLFFPQCLMNVSARHHIRLKSRNYISDHCLKWKS